MAETTMTKKKPDKPSNTLTAVRGRRIDFANAYLSNGQNATQAAISAGFSVVWAKKGGASKLLKHPAVQKIIQERTAKAMELAGVSIERTLREVARIAYADPRRLFRADGTPIPIHELDEDTAAIVASTKCEPKRLPGGEIGTTFELKTVDKMAALQMAMKYLGLYERDNAQRAPNLALQVNLIGPP